jgi:hypothetical protein
MAIDFEVYTLCMTSRGGMTCILRQSLHQSITGICRELGEMGQLPPQGDHLAGLREVQSKPHSPKAAKCVRARYSWDFEKGHDACR